MWIWKTSTQLQLFQFRLCYLQSMLIWFVECHLINECSCQNTCLRVCLCVCMFVCAFTKRLVVCQGRLVVLISSLLLSVPMLSPSPMQQGQVWKVCKVYHLPLINPAPSFHNLPTSPHAFVPSSCSPPGYLYWSVPLLLCGSSTLPSPGHQKQALNPVPLGLNNFHWMQEISIISLYVII